MGTSWEVEVRVHRYDYRGDRDEKILELGFTTPNFHDATHGNRAQNEAVRKAIRNLAEHYGITVTIGEGP